MNGCSGEHDGAFHRAEDQARAARVRRRSQTGRIQRERLERIRSAQQFRRRQQGDVGGQELLPDGGRRRGRRDHHRVKTKEGLDPKQEVGGIATLQAKGEDDGERGLVIAWQRAQQPCALGNLRSLFADQAGVVADSAA